MTDLISVCIPTYNGDKYLAESLNSVTSQTYSHLEVIVQDDGSSDKTIEIVKSFQKKDNRIRLLANKINLGLVENWNECIKQAKGGWVKLHFQDDLMEPDALEKMMSFGNDNGLEVVLTDREFIFEEGTDRSFFDGLVRLRDYYSSNTVLKPSDVADIYQKEGIKKNFVGEPILGLIKKSVFLAYGNYDKELKQIPDFEFWLRISLNIKIGFIAESLHSFRVHKESESNRNATLHGINPSHMDRIHLSYKMNFHPMYENLRSLVDRNFTFVLFKNYLTAYTDMYGRKLMLETVDKKYLEYLDAKPSALSRVLKFLGFASDKKTQLSNE